MEGSALQMIADGLFCVCLKFTQAIATQSQYIATCLQCWLHVSQQIIRKRMIERFSVHRFEETENPHTCNQLAKPATRKRRVAM